MNTTTGPRGSIFTCRQGVKIQVPLTEIHQSASLLGVAMVLEVAYLAEFVPASSAWRWVT
jgi:hypothetical protein